jgi:alpha-1,3-rhamnosyl/mannosyltransferase
MTTVNKSRHTLLINDLVLLREKTGIAAYTTNLLNALDAEGFQYKRLSETILGMPLKWGQQKAKNSSSGQKGKLYSLVQKYLKFFSSFNNYGLYHEPDAISFPISSKKIVTVHDLTVLKFPEWHPQHRVARYQSELLESLKSASCVMVNSLCTKKDLIELTGLNENKIKLIYHAPLPQYQKIDSLPKKKFFIFIGTLEPRKNILGLIAAHESLPREVQREYPLLLVGAMGWQSEEIQKKLKEVDSQTIQHLGYLSEDKLIRKLNEATALVYPSFYEGFGLPPLHAMQCETAVISSREGALSETVGEAGLFIDPRDVRSIREAMLKVIAPEVQADLIKKGRLQTTQFSWKETGRQTIEVYNSL